MHRKILIHRGPIDLYDATFLYEDIIHTRIPLVLCALDVNAENAHMEAVFGRRKYTVAIANPLISEGQNHMDKRVEIMDAFRYNPSIDFWKLHISLPVTRERAIHASKTGENEYEITLEAGSRRDLARMERLLYDTLDEEAAVRNG